MNNYFFTQNTAYNGTDLILFSNPKFLEFILITYFGLFFVIYLFKLVLLTSSLAFTSIGKMLKEILYTIFYYLLSTVFTKNVKF